MKNSLKRMAVFVLTLVMAAAMLSGCGSSKPKAEDAQAYVKAVLDAMCTGDYDHSVKFADLDSSGDAREIVLDAALSALDAEADLSDESRAAFADMMREALGKTRYTVGDAVATDDGGFDVTVTIEPLRLYDGFSENYEATLTQRVLENYDKVASMSVQEQNDFVMDVMLELIYENLADPQYDPPEDVVIHYGLLDEENNIWGASADEGAKLGEKLFAPAEM